MHPAALPSEALLRDCEVTRTRRSGPGGQHRNKVETAIVLKHLPTQFQSEAAERRSQAENLQMALWRLRVKLAQEFRSPPEDRETSPSELWRSRLRAGRISVSSEHEDFPTLLAEAWDVLADFQFELPPAAAQLECSASQLLKLISQEPAGLTLLNRQRSQRGLRPLR